MKYQEQTYTLTKTRNLLFANFPGVSNFTMKSILNAKRKKNTSNLIKVISDYDISTGNKSQQVQKQSLVIQYQKLLFFLKILLLHFINFFYRSM